MRGSGPQRSGHHRGAALIRRADCHPNRPGRPRRYRYRRDQAGYPGDRCHGAGSALHRGGPGDPGRPPRRQVLDPRMSPQEMQELAELLQNVPGIHSIDLKDVKRLAQLLRETPEIGSIEVKGWFGTGVVITRTTAPPVAAAAPVVVATAPAAAASAADPEHREAPQRAASAAPQLKEIRSPMVGT